ncbi:MAG: hypothetical protein OCC46_13425 [Pseudodesulfovibrio sp.]
MRFSFITPAILVIVIALFSLPAFANSDLQGPSFSDPAQKQDMPKEWQDKNITYEESMKDADLVIDLNQQIYQAFLPAVQAFATAENIKIVVMEGTCGKSAGRISRKEVDLASFCCPPGKVDRMPDQQFHTLGIMPLSLLVNPNNPVKSITLKQARDMYQGEIDNWSAMGGDNLTIKPLASLHCKLRPGHWRLLLGHEDLFGEDMLEVGEMSDMIALVASDPAAVGIETNLVANRFKERGTVRSLDINGISTGDLEKLLTLDYPLYRTFVFSSWSRDDLSTELSRKALKMIMDEAERLGPSIGLVPPSMLRKAGWQFDGNELIGEPVK